MRENEGRREGEERMKENEGRWEGEKVLSGISEDVKEVA